MISMQSFINYIEAMGLMPLGEPYKAGDIIIQNYINSRGTIMKPIVISLEYYSHEIVKSICTQFQIAYNEELVGMLS